MRASRIAHAGSTPAKRRELLRPGPNSSASSRAVGAGSGCGTAPPDRRLVAGANGNCCVEATLGRVPSSERKVGECHLSSGCDAGLRDRRHAVGADGGCHKQEGRQGHEPRQLRPPQALWLRRHRQQRYPCAMKSSTVGLLGFYQTAASKQCMGAIMLHARATCTHPCTWASSHMSISRLALCCGQLENAGAVGRAAPAAMAMPVRPEARATSSSSATTHASFTRASTACSAVLGSAT